MKKTMLALFIAVFGIGCLPNQPASPPTPIAPIVLPGIIHESDSGKLFTVVKGTNLTVEIPIPKDLDFYWSVDGNATVGGLLVMSETETNGVVRFVVQATSSGVMSINYQQFTDVGAKVIKTFLLKVEVK